MFVTAAAVTISGVITNFGEVMLIVGLVFTAQQFVHNQDVDLAAV